MVIDYNHYNDTCIAKINKTITMYGQVNKRSLLLVVCWEAKFLSISNNCLEDRPLLQIFIPSNNRYENLCYG